nr:MAG TPA: hypothetical protein [Caudoviricetes sp.]
MPSKTREVRGTVLRHLGALGGTLEAPRGA